MHGEEDGGEREILYVRHSQQLSVSQLHLTQHLQLIHQHAVSADHTHAHPHLIHGSNHTAIYYPAPPGRR